MAKFILNPIEINETSQVGGKAQSLAKLTAAGFPVPGWFVVTPQAFLSSLTSEQLETITHARYPQIGEVLKSLQLNESFLKSLEETVHDISSEGELLAIRSSAADEDSAQYSFAGQLETFLFVKPEQVAGKIVEVWLSGFSERVFSYRRERGIPGIPTAPAVIVQRMVNAEKAGVAFSVDPVTGDSTLSIVTAVYGLGTSLVSGDADADTWHVDSTNKIAKRLIAKKEILHQLNSATGSLVTVSVPQEQIEKPVLRDDQIVSVAGLARKAEDYFKSPQDIEWAIQKDKFFLLQSRPVTTLKASKAGERIIWDNSNIAESYGGVTTPLTFSFARRAYEKVYRQFCKLMGVPTDVIESNQDVFRSMLGFIQGRVYYNLVSWYRTLALFPGYQINRHFMEQMMGVKESLPEDVLGKSGQAGTPEKIKDALRLLTTTFGLIRNYFALDRLIQKFYIQLAEALGTRRPDLSGWSEAKLCGYYRDLERQLLTRWDAPLVNDFLAMIFYGTLKKLCVKWCNDVDGTLQNDLVSAQGGMVSSEPARRVREMAKIAAEDVAFARILCNGNPDEISQVLKRNAAFKGLFNDYLEKFGDRCTDELKLESPTLLDDASPLLKAVGQLASHYIQNPKAARLESNESLRGKAELQVRHALSKNPFRSFIFGWILKNARARVRDRENLRFERTRVFGRVRMIFSELGRRYHGRKLLDDPRDIFFLEVEEALGFANGTASCTDLRGLASVRKTQHEKFLELDPPPNRFETYGVVNLTQNFAGSQSAVSVSGEERRGIGCCPGKVSGPVQLVVSPQQTNVKMGGILVAERTDPSWIMIFPLAAGLLVERGSLLSHSAIVAREMGIPTIVSIDGLMKWLKDGDEVEFDGSTGIVKKINSNGETGASRG